MTCSRFIKKFSILNNNNFCFQWRKTGNRNIYTEMLILVLVFGLFNNTTFCL